MNKSNKVDLPAPLTPTHATLLDIDALTEIFLMVGSLFPGYIRETSSNLMSVLPLDFTPSKKLGCGKVNLNLNFPHICIFEILMYHKGGYHLPDKG